VTDPVAVIASRLGRIGIDLVGTTSVAAYDARVPADRRLGNHAPDARGVIVLGNGGTALWPAFRAAMPEAETDDPLDRFTRRAVEAATRDLPEARCCYPFD